MSLKLFSPDYRALFCLHTDAIEIGALSILFQRGDRHEEKRIVPYTSKKCSDIQKQYSAVERKCLTIIWVTDKFRPYFETRHFELFTDNAALMWLHRTKDKMSKSTR